MALVDAADDIAYPRVRRRMWRRVWIGLAIFLIAMPVLFWVAIDQGGKREWQRVQAELRAKGEATSVAELDLPSHGDIPDAENFGALKWLRANEDGSVSKAQQEMGQLLEVFNHYRSSEGKTSIWAEGNAFIGLASDRKLKAQSLQKSAEELEIAVTLPAKSDGTKDSSPATILPYLQLHDEIWNDLVAAKGLPHAQLLPTYSDRLNKVDLPVSAVATVSETGDLARALRWRALDAIHRVDTETLLQTFEVGARLIEINANEQNLIGFLKSLTVVDLMQLAAVEVLWKNSASATLSSYQLKRLQSAWQTVEFERLLHRAIRCELALILDTVITLPTLRESSGLFRVSSSIGFVGEIAPLGWYYNSAAFVTELYDRNLLSDIRAGTSLGELIKGAERMFDDVNALNRIERFNHYIVILSIPAAAKIIQRSAHAEARRRQIVIACALQRYQLEHGGKIPDSLDRLIPDYLDSVPLDPLDGKPMRYSLSDGAGGFRLWSIGLDDTDDGGELKLDKEEPERTRIRDKRYLGDWPWPTEPRDFERPPPEETLRDC